VEGDINRIVCGDRKIYTMHFLVQGFYASVCPRRGVAIPHRLVEGKVMNIGCPFDRLRDWLYSKLKFINLPDQIEGRLELS
jgi:hypothetical protein